MTPCPPPPPRDCSRGRGAPLSGQKPGAMTMATTDQEARPTERGRWSVQHGFPGARWMGNRPRYSLKRTLKRARTGGRRPRAAAPVNKS